YAPARRRSRRQGRSAQSVWSWRVLPRIVTCRAEARVAKAGLSCRTRWAKAGLPRRSAVGEGGPATPKPVGEGGCSLTRHEASKIGRRRPGCLVDRTGLHGDVTKLRPG